MCRYRVLTDDQLVAASVEPFATKCLTGKGPGDLLAGLQAVEQAVLQSPEVQALRKDAERYSKLVSAWFDNDHNGDFILMNNMPPDAYQSKVDIDADIDAAREKQP